MKINELHIKNIASIEKADIDFDNDPGLIDPDTGQPARMFLIYGDTGQTYNQGDVIPAGFGGNKMLYMGEPEIQNPTGFQPAVDNVNVSPLVISVDDIGHPLWSHYVVVKNVTIGDQEDSYGVRTITDADGATGAIYSGTFFVDLPEDLSKKYDIYGIINAYKSVYQILPTQFVPAE